MLNTCQTMHSRIPVRSRHSLGHVRTASAPSKLEQLAQQYQQKLLLEKERKIVAFHLERQNRSLQRLNGPRDPGARAGMRNGYGSAGSILPSKASLPALGQPDGGMLRNFFHERRALAKGQINDPHLQQNISHHYKQKKAAYKSDYGEDVPSSGTGAKPPRPGGRNSAGRDKSHPLKPLDRKPHHRRYSDSPVNMIHADSIHQDATTDSKQHCPKPPPFESKPKMVRQHRRGSHSSYSSSGDSPVPDISSLPKDKALVPISSKPQKVNRETKRTNVNHPQKADNENLPPSGPSPSKKVSNYKKWQLEQEATREQRRINSGRNKTQSDEQIAESPPKVAQPKKMSDFQKFQMEQDQAHAERLRKFNEQKNHEQQEYEISYSGRDNTSRRTPTSSRALEPISNNSSRPPASARSPTKTSSRQTPPADWKQQRKQSILKNTRVRSPEHIEQENEHTDERRRKEAELVEMIEQRQRELDRMKKQRAKEDQEAAKERERQKKKAEKLRERQRRQSEREEQERNWSQANHNNTHENNEAYSGRYDNYSRSSSRREVVSHRGSPEKSYITPPPPKQKARLPPKRSMPEREPTPNNENTAFYLEMAATDGAVENVALASCPSCGRNFAADRLAKHTKVCRNSSKKKRKVFDPVKMRTEGTELAQYTKTAAKSKLDKKPSKSNWRAQHDSFIKSIRYAKKVTEVEAQGGNVADLPPPPVTENPNYKQCPHCSRKFNPATAERHIPKCKDIKARPAPPKQRRR